MKLYARSLELSRVLVKYYERDLAVPRLIHASGYDVSFPLPDSSTATAEILVTKNSLTGSSRDLAQQFLSRISFASTRLARCRDVSIAMAPPIPLDAPALLHGALYRQLSNRGAFLSGGVF